MGPWRRRALAALALAMVVSMGGCGDNRAERVTVSGRVLVDGRPLEFGNIRIHPQDQRAALGKIGPGGVFTMSTYEIGDGCVLGNHAVTVYAVEALTPQSQRWHAPKKYAAVASSGLTIDVAEPTDSAEIHLTWDGGKPFDEHIEGSGI